MRKYLFVLFILFALFMTGCGNANDIEYVSVNYYSENGELLKTDKVIKGEKAEQSLVLENEGYTFGGWSYKGEKWSFIGYVVTEDIDLFPIFTINQYTLTIKYNDGLTPDLVLKQNFNSDIQGIANPERTGYTFIQWSEDIPEKMPAEDRTIEAKWLINQYSLTIDYNDGITPNTILEQ
ncbi:MAG: InlB B-repeat-containing protein, partial [Bacilli bacterium]|nr:InlB B-repeat-containing protein [Bacilli bacterium]